MRIKIRFKSLNKQLLVYDYLHSISSWIYARIGDADREFADNLHRSNKPKGFTFSYLRFTGCERIDTGFVLEKGTEITLYMSIANTEILPLFLQSAEVGSYQRMANIDLILDNIEFIRKPRFNNYIFRSVTPIHVTKYDDSRIVLHPTDVLYTSSFFGNLNNKLANPYDEADLSKFSINFLTRPKEVLHKLKYGKIKAYKYDFTLNCPPALALAGHMYGFGRLNSQGYGFVK
jgi:CRISPR-associated endoribonuclease Cas6